MTNKKICLYAICKNEVSQVDTWVENMSEADYIVVLDTGSTDGTYEKLKENPKVTRVEQKIINPWRFDVARNESLKLAPEDAEIFVCTDFDERFVPGWGKVLREGWEDDADRGIYMYAWDHNESGEPTNVFHYDKIHTRGYKWIFPVHEVLWPDYDRTTPEKRIDFGEQIYLHHYQDLTKNRKSYLDLLKISVEENPDSPHVHHLYAREFFLQGDYVTSRREFIKILRLAQTFTEPFELVARDTYLMLASLALQLGEAEESLYWCNQFLRLDDTYREPYLVIADIYNQNGYYQQAKDTLVTMYSKTHRHYSWVEKAANWIDTDIFLLAVAELGLKNYNVALSLLNEVLKHGPNRIDVLKLKVRCLEEMAAAAQKPAPAAN